MGLSLADHHPLQWGGRQGASVASIGSAGSDDDWGDAGTCTVDCDDAERKFTRCLPVGLEQ